MKRIIGTIATAAILSTGLLGGSPTFASSENGTATAVTDLAVVSDDPYTNPDTFHRTEAEPDTFAFGSTIVSTFQVGRAPTCGASNIGWSVSTDAGVTWTRGFLPHTTVNATPPGPGFRTSDPVVAYDAKHDVWLIEYGRNPSLCTPGVHPPYYVSRSTDGAQTFGDPILVAQPRSSQSFDKEWIACDNTPTSPFYGNCYTAWDDVAHHFRLKLRTSTDGGLSWHRADVRRDTWVIGVQIAVQPDGTVVVVTPQCCPTRIDSFISTDGGKTFAGHGTTYAGRRAIRGVRATRVHGKLAVINEPPFISTDVDKNGRIYVTWYDCRFRQRDRHDCTQNDIVWSSSLDGRRWGDVSRIPVDSRRSSVDHFFPAIAVDPTTSGLSAHLGIVYYFYPDADCRTATCELSVGFASSSDGGGTWAFRRHLAGPMNNTWLPLRGDGYFVGDYFSVSFIDGKAVPVFTVATEGTCDIGDVTSCHTWEASATIPI